ncbi:hypothetical protein L1887_58718 [Cichorium endivia]|nr:hypothetical protein L1887_58718 [Cichorium endivia]
MMLAAGGEAHLVARNRWCHAERMLGCGIANLNRAKHGGGQSGFAWPSGALLLPMHGRASLTAASLPRARAQLISVPSKCERCPELARHTGGGRRSLRVVRRGSTRFAQVFERSSTHGAQGRANRVASASEVGRAHPRRGGARGLSSSASRGSPSCINLARALHLAGGRSSVQAPAISSAMPSAALTELHFPAHSSCHLRLHAEPPAGSAFVQAKRADVQPRLARGFPTLLWPRVLRLLLPRAKSACKSNQCLAPPSLSQPNSQRWQRCSTLCMLALPNARTGFVDSRKAHDDDRPQQLRAKCQPVSALPFRKRTRMYAPQPSASSPTNCKASE